MPTLASPQSSLATWDALADKAIAGEELTTEEALSIIEADDTEILAILHSAYRIRRHFFGKQMKLNMLINAKSGHCREDCNYCSQSSVSEAEIEKYPMLDKETLLAGAHRAVASGASTYCIVCSGRSPNGRVMDGVVEAVREIKATMPLKLCACLGFLADEDASRLKEAGVDRYNHNLNTSSERYAEVCTTHTHGDRVDTINRARSVGLSACSGIIVGMGEKHEDLVDMARDLRRIGADSIPINLLHPIPGTPMSEHPEVDPMFAIKVIAMYRFLCPDREIRVAGGREANLRALQPLAFFAANSMFVGDYLTTDGQAIDADHQMLKDMGFSIEQPGVANS